MSKPRTDYRFELYPRLREVEVGDQKLREVAERMSRALEEGIANTIQDLLLPPDMVGREPRPDDYPVVAIETPFVALAAPRVYLSNYMQRTVTAFVPRLRTRTLRERLRWRWWLAEIEEVEPRSYQVPSPDIIIIKDKMVMHPSTYARLQAAGVDLTLG